MVNSLQQWFQGSYACLANGQPQPFYHGSVSQFTSFSKDKIRAAETDAPYNGFWFTSEKQSASPAWTNPKFVLTCYLRLVNPAPHHIITEVDNFVFANLGNPAYSSFRSSSDIVRAELQRLGYDGVIHMDIPRINVDELCTTGKTQFRTVKGTLHYLEFARDLGGLDFFNAQHEFITGYSDLEDFMRLNSERIFVVFEPAQIQILRIDPARGW